MKTKFTLVLILMAAFSLVNAQAYQVPNGSFETWANAYQPTGWATNNGLFQSDLGFGFKDSVDKVDGNYSIALISDSLSLAPSVGVVPSILSLGTASYTPGVDPGPIYKGIAFPYRPDTIFFSYKYATTGADTGGIQLNFTKNHVNVFGSLQNGGGFGLGDTHGAWANVYAVLTTGYLNATVPDTLLMQFYSSEFGDTTLKGSTLHVDHVRFGYVQLPTGVEELTTETVNINLYPNPAADQISIASSANLAGATIEVFDLTGRLVINSIFEGASVNTISTATLSNGAYIYRITGKESKVITQNKFIIVK